MKLLKLPKRHTYRISYSYKLFTLFEICSHDGYENIKAFTEKGAIRKLKRSFSFYKDAIKNLIIEEVEVID